MLCKADVSLYDARAKDRDLVVPSSQNFILAVAYIAAIASRRARTMK